MKENNTLELSEQSQNEKQKQRKKKAGENDLPTQIWKVYFGPRLKSWAFRFRLSGFQF